MIINKAHNLCQQAIKKKQLIRPDKCSNCGISCKPFGHHTDYEKPLEVVWLCRKCHRNLHKTLGKGKNHGGKIGCLIYVTDEAKLKLDIISKAENRTQTGEIEHLLQEQAKRLDVNLIEEIEKAKVNDGA